MPARLLRILGLGKTGPAHGGHHGLPRSTLPPETPLDDLPWLAFDTETTGLDPLRDRVVSIGALPYLGALPDGQTLDRLINPQRPMPPAARRIHGIDDAMLVDAPPFATEAEELFALWRPRALIGHNIAFDLAMLREEAHRSGTAFCPPATSLDIGLIYAALHPRAPSYALEAIAASLGASLGPRHTALGDAESAASLWLALQAPLAARGIVTLGGAQALMRRARALMHRQREAGWATDLLVPHGG